MTTASGFTTRTYESIDDVPVEQWDGLLSDRSLIYSHAFWRLIDQSALNDFSYRFLIVHDGNDRPVALAGYYMITTDIAIFAPGRLRRLLGHVRRLFPRFMKIRMVECGTPITVNAPLVMAEGVDPRPVVDVVSTALLAVAREARAPIVVVRDFEPGNETLQQLFAGSGFLPVENLPNTVLPIRWNSPDEYHAAMKSYFRSKLKKHLRRTRERGVTHRLVDDFADLADTLCRQWVAVHVQADEFQREVLTPEFYRLLSSRFGERSKVILFYRDQVLIGHALLLVDGATLRWLYYGREQVVNDGFYIYVGNAVVETAIALGLSRIDMGMTTYDVKKDLGASMVPVGMALKSPYGWLDPLIRWAYPLLNHTPAADQRQVFKQIDPPSAASQPAPRDRS